MLSKLHHSTIKLPNYQKIVVGLLENNFSVQALELFLLAEKNRIPSAIGKESSVLRLEMIRKLFASGNISKALEQWRSAERVCELNERMEVLLAWESRLGETKASEVNAAHSLLYLLLQGCSLQYKGDSKQLLTLIIKYILLESSGNDLESSTLLERLIPYGSWLCNQAINYSDFFENPLFNDTFILLQNASLHRSS